MHRKLANHEHYTATLLTLDCQTLLHDSLLAWGQARFKFGVVMLGHYGLFFYAFSVDFNSVFIQFLLIKEQKHKKSLHETKSQA